MFLDPFSAGRAYGLAFGRVAGKRRDGIGPFGRVFGQKTCFAGRDDFAVGPDGTGDHRQSRGHVLNDFETAFAERPTIPRRRGDADVAAAKRRGFGLL